ncbi:MAG TPA: sigma-70 family RNA polymerase sigma factor [Bacteroidota bacterium]|nr:sigma-70 family RNA polymerase sigma factor [Bacteroidota bacterium]
MKEREDSEVVKRCLAGETDAFGEIVDRYQKVVFNAVVRMINDADDAQDVAQTVFIKAYENLNSYNPQYKFFSWLYKIAVNEGLNFIRHRKHTDELDVNTRSSDRSPEEAITESELSEPLDKAMKDLKEEYRTVIVMKHLLGLSYKEMSDLLSVPEKTIKSRLFSARQILKDRMIRAKSRM